MHPYSAEAKKQTQHNPIPVNGWVYGTIEYPHDVLSPRDYFIILRAHPKAKVPKITGGYATTDVYVKVRLRGVSTPRSLQSAYTRNRPHIYLQRERQRWNNAMQYVWNIMQPNKTFRVGNFKLIEKGRNARSRHRSPPRRHLDQLSQHISQRRNRTHTTTGISMGFGVHAASAPQTQTSHNN